MFPTFTPEVHERWHRSAPFFVIGSLGIIGGGIAAAVTGPTDWSYGSWCAAFLVLVVGVAQLGLGAGQASLAPSATSPRLVLAEALAWNLGSAGVIAGTLVGSPALVSAASLVFLAAIALATFAVRGRPTLGGPARIALTVYRMLLLVLLVSTPVGIALSFIRN